jgi:DegV family protein with EDD domain
MELTMKIVTDSAADLSAEQSKDLDIFFAPLRITLSGKTYASGVDLQADEFYRMLSKTEDFPTTSMPSAGEFAEIYRRLAANDPDILSIHVSSGLSGTLDTARQGAEMVPEARVTFFDSLTLSCPLGWQVEFAARAVKAGWEKEKILGKLAEFRQKTEGIFTLPLLKYLVHGGRISHMKGLLASVLNIKPIITVDKEFGKYYNSGQEITFKRAIHKVADLTTRFYPEGTPLTVQPLNSNNLEGVQILCERMNQLYKCTFRETVPIAPVLGAHTGPGLVGMAFGPTSLWEGLP